MESPRKKEQLFYKGKAEQRRKENLVLLRELKKDIYVTDIGGLVCNVCNSNWRRTLSLTSSYKLRKVQI